MSKTPTNPDALATPPTTDDHQAAVPTSARQRNPSLIWPALVCFVLVTFLAAAGLVGLQTVLQLDLVVIEVVQFAPAIGVLAVLILRAITRRDVGRLPRPGLGHGAWSRLGLAALMPLLIMTAAIIGSTVTAGSAGLTRPSDLGAGFALVLLAQFIGACAEEIGWRGYLQPTLQRRWGLVPAAITVGLIWGCWHVQIFAAGPGYAGAFLLSTIAMSIVMAVLTEKLLRGKTLVAGAFHWVMNIAMLLALPEESGDPMAMLWIALGCAAGAVLALIVRHRLSHRPVNA